MRIELPASAVGGGSCPAVASPRLQLIRYALGASDVRIACLGIFVGVMAYAVGSWSTGAALECGRNLVVHFPRVPLKPGERVVGIKLTVVGGSVVAVGSIPRDWSISVEPEVSGAASVSGSPQHGAGAL